MGAYIPITNRIIIHRNGHTVIITGTRFYSDEADGTVNTILGSTAESHGDENRIDTLTGDSLGRVVLAHQ